MLAGANGDALAAVIEIERVAYQITQLGRSASFEATAAEILTEDSWAAQARRGSLVYIPHLPNARLQDTVTAAAKLRAFGLIPVPHIAVRRFSSWSALTQLLGRLRDSGCEDLLLIAGSATVPQAPFASTIRLLSSGLLERFGFRRIGVAGHPEGSSDVPEPLLWEALREKNLLAQAVPFDLHIVTQFCFEASSIESWERRARDLGNRLPVHVGVPGLTSLRSLFRFASMCGVRLSANLVRQGWKGISSAMPGWTPGPIVVSVAVQMVSQPATLLKQMHFFPFGGLKSTIAWINALAEGRFSLQMASSGLRLSEVRT